MITMFYAILGKLLKELLNANKTGHHVIPDTLLKVSLSTNKTGHHVICYNWYIFESVIKHQ